MCSVLFMSAAAAACTPTSNITGNARDKPVMHLFIIWNLPCCRSLGRACPPRCVHVEVQPRMLVEDVVLVAQHPRIDEHGLVAEGVELPRRVSRHQLRHALEKTSALRRVGQQARLVVELVVFRKLETGEVRNARMRAVE